MGDAYGGCDDRKQKPKIASRSFHIGMAQTGPFAISALRTARAVENGECYATCSWGIPLNLSMRIFALHQNAYPIMER